MALSQRLFNTLCLMWFVYQGPAQVVSLPIETEWVFSDAAASDWQEAQIPGYVHQDLYRLGKISNPLTGTGETDCLWVEEKEWIYQSFPFDAAEVISHKRILLQFEGLDTFADVYLNDSLVISADNAFMPWSADVKDILKPQANVIRVLFHALKEKSADRVAQLLHPLPGDAARAVIRKPQYQFGWDWGPRMLSCGITGKISLVGYSTCMLHDVFIRQVKADSLVAELDVQLEIHALQSQSVNVTLVCRETSDIKRGTYKLRKGANIIHLQHSISNPRWWWCNGEGEPFLYHFEIELSANGTRQYSHEISAGIRTIELIQAPDSMGTSFYFKLNGKRIFAKGANYIPVTPFPSPDDTIEQAWLLGSCADARMNMLRVWGGGVYEQDWFYDECDKRGLLVWQDFMFACTMYPGNESFINSVEAEAIAQVKRLRNHPCIVMWCGNNEVSEGWHRWGWQSGLSVREQKRIWQSYHLVFQKLLKGVVSTMTDLPYHESSPTLGRGDNLYLNQGDAHDWWVWHDAKPFEHFDTHCPRFMSEFGFQSFPSEEVLFLMMNGETLQRSDPGWLLHQKHARGFELIDRYMELYYPEVNPDSIRQYAYLSQLVQAEGITKGIYAQRSGGDRCGGSLYWQLNDTWPSFSWSSIDYNGDWKALHYFAKRAFAPLACFARGNEVLVINEKNTPPDHSATLYHMTLGRSDQQVSGSELLPDSSWYMLHRFNNAGGSSEIRLFHPDLQWNALPQPHPVVDVRKATSKGYPVHITSDTFCRYVRLTADIAGHFSDNYFDLDAGETKIVYFIPRYEDEITPLVSVTTLFDTWHR